MHTQSQQSAENQKSTGNGDHLCNQITEHPPTIVKGFEKTGQLQNIQKFFEILPNMDVRQQKSNIDKQHNEHLMIQDSAEISSTSSPIKKFFEIPDENANNSLGDENLYDDSDFVETEVE